MGLVYRFLRPLFSTNQQRGRNPGPSGLPKSLNELKVGVRPTIILLAFRRKSETLDMKSKNLARDMVDCNDCTGAARRLRDGRCRLEGGCG
jgi:hypothetical protein